MTEELWKHTPCMDPVCMSTTKALIKELRTRYSTGAFVLYHPVPQTKEQYDQWVEDNQESGFTVWPERFHRQNNNWGHTHILLGLLTRLIAKINGRLEEEEEDIPEEEQI